MSRTLTGAVQTALAAANVPMLALVSMAFDSGTVYVTNAGYNVSWNGHTWLGLGRLGSIEAVKETPDLAANAVNLKLSGVPTASVTQALTEHYQGRACNIYIAPLSADYTILADPVLIFSGRMNTMDLDIGATAMITLQVESRLADWDRPRVRRYNDADQQAEYPGDLGLQYVEQMVEKVLDWTVT